MNPKIVITIENGIVSVISDAPVDVCEIDYDIQGFPNDILTDIPYGIGTTEAICSIYESEINIEQTNKLFTLINNDTERRIEE